MQEVTKQYFVLVSTYIDIFSPKKLFFPPVKYTSQNTCPAAQNQPRIDFSYYKYVPRLICLPISAFNPNNVLGMPKVRVCSMP
jgi:hypothetical protein